MDELDQQDLLDNVAHLIRASEELADNYVVLPKDFYDEEGRLAASIILMGHLCRELRGRVELGAPRAPDRKKS